MQLIKFWPRSNITPASVLGLFHRVKGLDKGNIKLSRKNCINEVDIKNFPLRGNSWARSQVARNKKEDKLRP